MSYSNPMHHADGAHAPVRPARPVDLLPLTPATAGLLRQRETLTRQIDALRAALRWALDQIDDDLDPDHQAAVAHARALTE